jgi:hypothetical protein
MPSHENASIVCDLGRVKGKWRDNEKVITAINLLQGPRTLSS